MKIGFLFAGLGSQYVSMGKDFYDHYEVAKEVYNQAGEDIKNICFYGDEEVLNDTAYAQPCILTTSIAIAKVIESMGIIPDYVAGLSLGEYSALTFAKAFDIKDAIDIVKERGKIMSEALPKNTTGMAAILGMDASKIEEVIDNISNVTIANYNCPSQIVITGTNEGIVKASEALKDAGAKRIVPLKVSGAFHSPLLEDASYLLKDVLKKYKINKPTVPVIYNISGKEEDKDIIDILTLQIKSSVYFYQSLEYMINQGVEAFVEIGPGSSLSSFVKKTNRKIPVYSIDKIEDLEKLEVLKNE